MKLFAIDFSIMHFGFKRPPREMGVSLSSLFTLTGLSKAHLGYHIL
jgi:hypothetical protein